MFMITLGKKSLRVVGALAICGIAVGAFVVGKGYFANKTDASGESVAPIHIDSTEDIQTYFTGYGIDIDAASITVDTVQIPRSWDDHFSSFHAIVAQSGLSLSDYKGETVEKWVALVPANSTGEEEQYAVLLVHENEAIGAYLLSKPSGIVTGLADAVQAAALAQALSGQVEVLSSEDAAETSADDVALSDSGDDTQNADEQASLDVQLEFNEDGFPVD